MSSWFEVTVEVPEELGEAAASLLIDLGSPGLECSDRNGTTSLVAYFRDMPPLDDLRRLCSTSPDIQSPAPNIQTRTITEQDWAEGWKRNFQPLAIGDRILVSPPWDLPTSSNRTIVVIEPGMAFGTGQHPTTQGCLELLQEAVGSGGISRALDVGTGSGILAIALVKLGVPCVYAVDNDPTAREASAENIRKNGVAASIRVMADWEPTAGTFDLIVANLFTNLLRDLSGKLLQRLAPNGSLICSGFLSSDEDAVVKAYGDLQVVERRKRDDWVTVTLRRRDSSN